MEWEEVFKAMGKDSEKLKQRSVPLKKINILKELKDMRCDIDKMKIQLNKIIKVIEDEK